MRRDAVALPPPSAGPPALPPRVERVGRYFVFDPIGRGGMGAVHLGLMTGVAGFSRWVAIKRLRAEWSDHPKLTRRFKTEVRLSASVVHPNVVRTTDVLDAEGELVLVMDHVEGVTLAALLSELRERGERLSPELAAAIVVPVLHGLHAAHVARDVSGKPLGIVHRDVSPQNVMLGVDGQVQVLDFGVARASDQTQLTRAGSFAGKVSYLAPEQLEGVAEPRTDVFAAGILLWEMLTGRRLFRSRDSGVAESLRRVLHERIPAPSEHRAHVPPALDEAVVRALERELERRHESAEAFAAALRAAVVPASTGAVAELVCRVGGARLEARRRVMARARRVWSSGVLAEPAWADLPTAVVATAPPAPARRRRRLADVALVMLGVALGVAASMLDAVGTRPPGERRASERAASEPTAGAAAAASRPPAPSTAPIARDSPKPRTSASPGRALDGAPPSGPKHAALDGVRSPAPAAPEPQTVRRVDASRTARRTARGNEASRRKSRRSRRAVRVATAPTAARARSGARASDCDPPTYLDLDGIRRFKKGCL